MLIPFTVDPDIFLAPTANLDCLKRHEALIRLWGLIGQLVIPGNKESESTLLAAIRKSPPKVQLRWSNAFKNYRKRCGTQSFADALSAAAPIEDSDVCDGIRLASLDEIRGELWGLEDEQFSKLVAKSLEICRFGHEDSTEIVKHALELAARPIAANESVSAVWRERFLSLASISRVITVVDRYAVKGFLRPTVNEMSGLERLLRNVAALGTPGKKVIHIYSAYSLDWGLHGSAQTFESACQRIVAQITQVCEPLVGKSILEVNLHLAGDYKFGSVVHYRYLLFDDQNLIQLDTGLEPLSGSVVKRTCPVHLVRWRSQEAEEYMQDEKKLKSVLEHNSRIDCR
jgi:hypothetical protein